MTQPTKTVRDVVKETRKKIDEYYTTLQHTPTIAEILEHEDKCWEEALTQIATKAVEDERERIVKDIRLASLIDSGGDGFVSVKMGIGEIEKIIRK